MLTVNYSTSLPPTCHSNLDKMARKNKCGSKKRDRRAVAKRAAELATVFHQEEFNEEYRWYHDVVRAEEDDIKVV